MRENSFIQKFYLNFLCFKELYKNAVYFAVCLDLDKTCFPSRLSQYCNENPEELKSIKEEIEK